MQCVHHLFLIFTFFIISSTFVDTFKTILPVKLKKTAIDFKNEERINKENFHRNLTKEIKNEMRKDAKETQNQIKILKTKLDNYEDENRSLKKSVEQILKLVERLNNSPIHQGYNFLNGRWLIGNAKKSNYATALEWCQNKNAKICLPKSSKDNDYLEQFRVANNLPFMWYPMSDKKTEGKFLWQDETAVTKYDEEWITWKNSELYKHNDDTHDCSQIDNNGVRISKCSDTDAGVMCMLN